MLVAIRKLYNTMLLTSIFFSASWRWEGLIDQLWWITSLKQQQNKNYSLVLLTQHVPLLFFTLLSMFSFESRYMHIFNIFTCPFAEWELWKTKKILLALLLDNKMSPPIQTVISWRDKYAVKPFQLYFK